MRKLIKFLLLIPLTAAAQPAADPKSEAASLAASSAAEYNASHDDRAEKLARQSLAIAERIADLPSLFAALKALDDVLYRQSRFRELEPNLQRVLSVQTQLGDRKGIAIALNNIGNLARHMGDRFLAIDYLSRAETEFAALADDRSRGVVLNNIGLNYSDLGDYTRALEFCRRGLALSESAKDDLHTGTTSNAIAVTEMYRGNYRESLRYYQQAMEAGRRAEHQWGMAEVANNIGLLYQAQQNHEQAIAYFQQALEMNRTLKNASLAGEAHRALGDEMLALNRLPEAFRHFRECLSLTHDNAIHPLEAEAHRGLGSALFRMNRIAEAERELLAAAADQRRYSDSANLAQTYAELSHLRLREGHAEDALQQARQAIELLDAVDRPETLWQAQAAAGSALQRLGRNAEAAREFEASMSTIESLRTRVAGPPTALPLYFADKLEPYRERVALAIAAGQIDDALRFAERSKSRALADILRSSRASLDKSLTPQERDSEQRLRSRLAGLNLQIEDQPAAARLKTERDQARLEFDALEGSLYAAHPETAFQRGMASPVTAAGAAKLASDTGAVILDYFVTPRNILVFVIRPGARARVVSLGTRTAALAAQAADFYRQLSDHDLNYAASAEALYRLLLAPLEHDLEGQSAVIVLPDGALWDVAFHALKPAPHHFLIERLSVSYAPSLDVLRETVSLARARHAAPAPHELLALGNPAGRDPLPEAERQVAEIEKLYGARQSRVLTGAAATVARMQSDAGNYRVLHLASHAVLDSVNPMYSHALLARSGADAGILEARELMQFNLKAELLVLSACETARGRALGGEGISGMLWAAFVAGAPTTLASLWRVESASTSDLMIAFHRDWLAARTAGRPFAKAAALQSAARSLIAGAKYSHPFYWAGFILVGSPF